MFHPAITILTTLAVALHAILGCCAHHGHAAADADHAALVHEAGGHAGEESCTAEQQAERPAPALPQERGDGTHDEHDGDGHRDCDEVPCSFTADQRSEAVQVLLIAAMLCPLSGDVAEADDGLLGSQSVVERSLDPLSLLVAARSTTQVWQL